MKTISQKIAHGKLQITVELAEDDPQFLEWTGGDCPVEVMTVVEYKLRASSEIVNESAAGFLEWSHDFGPVGVHIVGYRIKPLVHDYNAKQSANARLITAAPDLLFALQLCKKIFDGKQSEINMSVRELADLCNTAIEKAGVKS